MSACHFLNHCSSELPLLKSHILQSGQDTCFFPLGTSTCSLSDMIYLVFSELSSFSLPGDFVSGKLLLEPRVHKWQSNSENLSLLGAVAEVVTSVLRGKFSLMSYHWAGEKNHTDSIRNLNPGLHGIPSILLISLVSLSSYLNFYLSIPNIVNFLHVNQWRLFNYFEGTLQH